MKFRISTYSKCGPLAWGDLPSVTANKIGPADFVSKNRAGNRIEFRFNRSSSFIFDKTSEGLIEVACSREPSGIIFSEINLNDEKSEVVVNRLFELDRNAMQGHGSIVFPLLGIALTGYLPEDYEIRAVSAFSFGRWDSVIKTMKPLIPIS